SRHLQGDSNVTDGAAAAVLQRRTTATLNVARLIATVAYHFSLPCGEQKRQNQRCVNQHLETRSLKQLTDMCNEFSGTSNSLRSKKRKRAGRRFVNNFNFHLAKYINHAAEGFVFLRKAKSPRIAASKLLVRPVLEMHFRLQAVQKRPELLY